MAFDSDEGELGLFQEPSDYYQPEKEPTFATHQLLSGKDLRVRLVGHNPLWVRKPGWAWNGSFIASAIRPSARMPPL
jgi:hypothetical protein